MKLKPIKIVTHSGGFHTDDVFAVATLLLLHPDAEILRSRAPKEMKDADYVVDVGTEYDAGAKKFDHHQEGGAGKRENGIPYAAFGLVWKEYGEKLCESKAIARLVEEKLVVPIDAFDNGVDLTDYKIEGVHPYLVENIFFSLEPTWQENNRTTEDGFRDALEIAKDVLEREIVHARAEVEGLKLIEDVYESTEDKQIVVMSDDSSLFDRGLLTKAFVKHPEVMYVVRKHEGGQWQAVAAVDSMHSFATRKPFPAAWAGKRGEELAEITGVEDALFCHNKRFIAIAKSREGAVKLAQLAVEK